LSFAPSSLISAISPEKSESGPEMTLTDSPIENWAWVRGRSAVSRWSRRSTSGFGGDEAGHARGVFHQAPSVVRHLHVDQHVAGHRPFLGLDFLPVFDLGDLFGGDDDLPHVVVLAHRLDTVLKVVLDLVLVP